jgi:TolB-like protein/class 3 adenylate cyclase
MAEKGFKRKLTAILSADVVEYSRLMGDDEEATVRTLTTYREVLTTLIQHHNGKVLDSPGDNLLAEFASVVDAVQCAVAVQKEISARNAALPENRRMQYRIGINLGDVIQEEERIYGDGVNIAARLEGLAEPGGICISKTAFDHIEGKLPYGYDFIGDQTVKNIAKPVGAYRVLLDPRVTVSGKPLDKKPALIRRMPVLVGVVVVLVLAVVVGIWQFYMHRLSVQPVSEEKMMYSLPDKPSIAVLPFVNMSDDPKQEFFSDGMTEDLITELSKMSALFVIARNSVFTYKGKPVKVQQVAEELRVRYVLEGSVRRAGDKVRISAQLIDTTKGGHLWAERYDGKIGDVFALQDNITKKIVDALAVKLTPTEQEQLARKDTDDITANQAFLQGWEHYLRLTAYDFAKAYSYYKKAIELDPVYWRAYAGLALLYWKGSQLGELYLGLDVSYLEARLRSREYLKIAMKDPTSLAHLVASEMNLLRRQYVEAIIEAKKAIALDPDDPSCHESFGWTLIMAGKPGEAVDFVKKAMRLDPSNPARYLYLLGLAHFAMGQLEEAVTSIEKARALNPDRLGMEATLAAAYAHLGLDQRTRAALDNYRKGWFGPLKLREVMYFYPFKDVEVADRFADGLLKAGLPGKQSGYYKLDEENKLSGEEIKELVFGRTTTGITPWARQEWWIERTNDGKATHQQIPFHSIYRLKGDSPAELYRRGTGTLVTRFESGKSWIEGDLLCSQWERVYESLKYCGTVFRNPESTPEMKDEYIKINDFGIIPFSPDN